MSPNAISHRLFAAALSSGALPVVKRSNRGEIKFMRKVTAAKTASTNFGVHRHLSQWSWSGWQHPMI